MRNGNLLTASVRVNFFKYRNERVFVVNKIFEVQQGADASIKRVLNVVAATEH